MVAVTALTLPIRLFGFAWTIQGPPIHWIGSVIFAPLVGIANYSICPLLITLFVPTVPTLPLLLVAMGCPEIFLLVFSQFPPPLSLRVSFLFSYQHESLIDYRHRWPSSSQLRRNHPSLHCHSPCGYCLCDLQVRTDSPQTIAVRPVPCGCSCRQRWQKIIPSTFGVWHF